MVELVRAIEKALGRPLKIVNKPLPQDDPARRRPDLTRARQLLGYGPQVSLEDGLRRTIAFFQRALECSPPSGAMRVLGPEHHGSPGSRG